MPKRATWLRITAVVTSGLLVAGMFPALRAVGLGLGGIDAPVGGIVVRPGRRAGRHGFALGWLAGSVSCAIQFHWIAVVSPLGAAILPVYLGLFWGAFGAFAATRANPWRTPPHPPLSTTPTGPALRRSLHAAIALALWWAGLEWLRSWLFTGLGWNSLGVAFAETPVMAQAADLLGVTGLSVVPLFFQAMVVQALGHLRNSRHAGLRLPRVARFELAAAAAAVALLAGYGLLRLAIERHAESVRLKTLLVQINIPQDAALVLWSALDVHLAYEDDTLAALEQLRNDPRNWPDWVMWPESALTGRFLRTADNRWATWRENPESIARVRQAGPFHLLFGTNELEAQPAGADELVIQPGGRVWNSLAVMSPEDDLQTFRKHHLVIFGETIPFVDTIPFLKKIYEQQAGIEYGGSFTPGVSVDPLPIPTATGTVIGAIPSVCFEDTVPRLTRRFVRPGPQVIVNVTNDGWFKQSTAAAQHFANARFRAIELRRPMLRCANTGVSAAINSNGTTSHPETGQPQILRDASGSHFTRGSLLTELNVPLHPSFSLYALIGDWGIITLALAALLTPTRRRSNRPSSI